MNQIFIDKEIQSDFRRIIRALKDTWPLASDRTILTNALEAMQDEGLIKRKLFTTNISGKDHKYVLTLP